MTSDVMAPGWGPPLVRTAVRPLRWVAAALLGVLVGAVAAVGVLAYGTVSYARAYESHMLPGTQVAGVDLTGMEPDAALRAVRAAVAPELQRAVTVSVGRRELRTTARDLGAHSDAKAVVAEAATASQGLRWDQWARLRWLDPAPGERGAVAVSYRRSDVRAFVDDVADRVDRPARDALLSTSGGGVQISPERGGRQVPREKATRSLLSALTGGGAAAVLPLDRLAPAVSADAFSEVLVLHQSQHRLELFRDGIRTHSWTVATGTGRYPTPLGRYEVTLKRYLPTWVNPSPDDWGKDLPASIPPGPGNPLGVRALNWSAPGAIRFHGTEAVESLGTSASHGCVRMSNADVADLYDLVDVGAVIVSLP